MVLDKKETAARAMAGSLCGKVGLKITLVGAWPAAEVFEWLEGMGYEWNGETWHKSSQ